MTPIKNDLLMDRIERLEWANRELTDRLDRAERSRRRMFRWGAAVVLGMAVLVGVGAASSDRTIEANRLIIRDWDGTPRIELGANENGVGYLLFFDREGTRRIDLGVYNGGGAYMLMDGPNGHRRIDLGTKGARSYLVFHDQNGDRRIDLGVNPDGLPYEFRSTADRQSPSGSRP